MRPNDIVCKICRERYNTSEFGCDICIPAKEAIIWPKAELPILESILAQNIRINEALANELEKEIKATIKKRGGVHPSHVGTAKSLTLANVQLVAEARKLRKEDQEQAARLSWDEKVELIVQMADNAPDSVKQQLLSRLTQRLTAVEAKLISDGS